VGPPADKSVPCFGAIFCIVEEQSGVDAVALKQIHGAWGDFYEVIPVGEGLVENVVADASGHKLETSLWTTVMKTLLHEHARSMFDPAGILKAVNRSLCRVMTDGLFFSVLYVRLNRKSGRLTLVNGGHPPAICLKNGDPFSVIEQTGDTIGPFADATFETTNLQLSQGDPFFLYTDRLVENSGSRSTGIEALGGLCQSYRDVSLAEAMDAATMGVLGRADVTDDIVLLGVEL
jgi:phosphoserine phosphatase RsbU/P